MKIKIVVILLALGFLFGAGVYNCSKPKRIAIAYIATGRYIDFWDMFYASAEKNFVPGMEKHYFVFTDDTKRTFPKNVTRIYQKQLEWPYIALLRYHLIDEIKNQLRAYDYAFFFNANAVIVSPIGPEILPDRKRQLIAAKHPAYFLTIPQYLPYEYNPKSKAFIPVEKRKQYFQSGFAGGRTEAYLAMNALLKQRVQDDLDNNLIAVWHDESHYNWFMAHWSPVILEPNYIFGTNLSSETVRKFAPNLKIIMLNKGTNLFGGHGCMRGQSECPRPYNYKNVVNGKLKYMIHPRWSDWVEFKTPNTVCMFNTDNCAPAKVHKDGMLQIDWSSGSEKFRPTDVDFVYVLENQNT